MLAESLCRAGIKAIVIDQFGDLDTRDYAARLSVVNELSADVVLAVVHALKSGKKPSVIYGSGVDNNPELLKQFALDCHLLGNHAEVVGSVRDPRMFFSLLDRLDIVYPATCFYRPQGRRWLFKQTDTEGGLGITPANLCDQAGADESGYFQQQLDGEPFSVLFLANGFDCCVIGLNSQWIVKQNASRPYVFKGVINRFELSDDNLLLINKWIRRIVSVTGLRGLNSLDCLVVDNQIFVLELNPRPGASIALYDDVYPGGLVRQHIASFGNGTLVNPIEPEHVSGSWIVFASDAWRIDALIKWPSWVVDRPVAGTVFRQGEPVCSVKATAGSVVQVQQQLIERCKMITQYLASLQPAGALNEQQQSFNLIFQEKKDDNNSQRQHACQAIGGVLD